MDYKIIITVVCLTVLLLGIFIGAFFVAKARSNKKPKIDNEFMSQLLANLGGIDNIKDASSEQGRLRVEVKDLDACNLEGLKSMTDKGIFVTGNTIKVLFKESTETIINNLKK